MVTEHDQAKHTHKLRNACVYVVHSLKPVVLQRARRDGPEQEETEDSGRTINMLQHQASRTFGSKMILATHDLFTLPIPLNPALQPTSHAPASPARLAKI